MAMIRSVGRGGATVLLAMLTAACLPAFAADEPNTVPPPVSASPDNPLTGAQVRVWAEWKAPQACGKPAFLGVVGGTEAECRRHVEDSLAACARDMPSDDKVYTEADEARLAAFGFLQCVLPPASPSASDAEIIASPGSASPENPLSARDVTYWSHAKAGEMCADRETLDEARMTKIECRMHVEKRRLSCAAADGGTDLRFTVAAEATRASEAYIRCVMPPSTGDGDP